MGREGERQWNSAINHAKNKCQVIYQRQHAANTSKGSEKSKGLSMLLWSGCIIKRMPRPQSQRHYQCKLRQTDCKCVSVCVGCVYRMCVCLRISRLSPNFQFNCSRQLWSLGQPHTHSQARPVYLRMCVVFVLPGGGAVVGGVAKFTKLHFGTQLVVHLLRG